MKRNHGISLSLALLLICAALLLALDAAAPAADAAVGVNQAALSMENLTEDVFWMAEAKNNQNTP